MTEVRKTVMIEKDLLDRYKGPRGHLSYLVNIWLADYVTKQEKMAEIIGPAMRENQEMKILGLRHIIGEQG